MTATYDLILEGGTVVNQDGVGVRDVGVTAGRIAEIGDLARAAAGRRVDCRGACTVLAGQCRQQVHCPRGRASSHKGRKPREPARAPP